MRFASVIVAAGSAARFGGEIPKQWRRLGERPMVRWSLEALLDAGSESVVLVVAEGQQVLAAKACLGLERWRVVVGGAVRQESVRAGLQALADDPPDAVLVHDAARPFLETATVAALLEALADADGALPGVPVPDTLKRVDAKGRILGTADRAGLWSAQTPQAFRYARLRDAYAVDRLESATDDAMLVEALGGRVIMVAGSPTLMKITYPEDMAMAERLATHAWSTRVGIGLDAHVFGPGDGVWLCGVHIPHDRGLIGHSDADAGLHALTDAILGALALGDIGDHFPPSDPRWKGAASDQFLRHAARLVHERGGRLANVDVTLVCEEPRIKPHRQAMRERVAEILGLAFDRVSVKATTMERMGFTGREEGLAAQACAAVETPT